MLAKKQSYTMSRINSLGHEYYNDTKQWDILIEREWIILEGRYNSGLGLEKEILETFGEDFFTKKQELHDEFLELYKDMEKREYGSQTLTVYTYEDFILLSNQGIFRDEIFIIDPQRRWKVKVINHLKDYGYDIFDNIEITKDHHFYEGIQKYDMFFAGWVDNDSAIVITKENNDKNVTSPYQRTYRSLWTDYNRIKTLANRGGNFMLFNRFISMVDALLLAKKWNNEHDIKLSLNTYPDLRNKSGVGGLRLAIFWK